MRSTNLRNSSASSPSVTGRWNQPGSEDTFRRECLLGAGYAIALVWLNVYICRELFWTPAGSMASMHGFWMALAERAQGAWFHLAWWPYWNGGMPFEFTYAPLVPAMMAVWVAIHGVSFAQAFNFVTGVVYVATPLALFAMAWVMTRSPGYGFFAALLYSLTAPTQLITTDRGWSLLNFWEARRLFLVAVWDDTPHLMAVALLPLAILLLWLSLRKPGLIYPAGAAMVIALATYASVFAPVAILLASICIVAALDRADWPRAIVRISMTGAFGYALAAAFLPPSLVLAMATSASGLFAAEGWTLGSLTALALVALGWAALWPWVARMKAPYSRFFTLFAYLISTIPVIDYWLHRHFLPQPGRYQFEMELAVSVALVFGIRPLIERASPWLKRAIVFLALALAAEQVVGQRQYAKTILRPIDLTRTIEYRVAMWTAQNLPGVRVMFPGSIAQWADAFAPVTQLSGGSWSIAANPVQQLGLAAVLGGGDTAERDARVSLAWLQAYGVGAIAVSGPQSPEFWKPYAHPSKFEGVLPVLWRESDTTIYRVPQRSSSLARVIPESALVRRAPASVGDLAEIERYAEAVEDPSLPAADFEWEGRNRIKIHASAATGEAISVQVTYDPGWHASVNGRAVPLHRDALGLMWLRPECSGPCETDLEYTGSFELRLCRWISAAAIASLFVAPIVILIRRRRPVK